MSAIGALADRPLRETVVDDAIGEKWVDSSASARRRTAVIGRHSR